LPIQPPSEVVDLAQARQQARKNKEWDLADQLREKIETLGWGVLDSQDGFELEKKDG
jgi:cysteinyl-tRNA synthetase